MMPFRDLSSEESSRPLHVNAPGRRARSVEDKRQFLESISMPVSLTITLTEASSIASLAVMCQTRRGDSQREIAFRSEKSSSSYSSSIGEHKTRPASKEVR
jgi:hypothetical protein